MQRVVDALLAVLEAAQQAFRQALAALSLLFLRDFNGPGVPRPEQLHDLSVLHGALLLSSSL